MSDIGREWEREFAAEMGGELVPASGALWFAKLDVGDRHFLWSLKATGKGERTIARDELREVVEACEGPGGTGDMPGMALKIDGEAFVLLRLSDFRHVVEEKIQYVKQSKADAKRDRARLPILLRDESEDG